MQVQIESGASYELLMSLYAFVHRKDQRTLDIGASWASQVEAQLGADFADNLNDSEYAKSAWLLEVLVWRCPMDRDVAPFLRWMGALSLGEMYELIMPYIGEGTRSLPPNLVEIRDKCLQLLNRWNDLYFSTIDPGILPGLAADAEQKKALLEKLSPYEVVEVATEGVVLEPSPSRKLVVLVPQSHNRPWNINSDLQGVKLLFYPADVLPTHPGEPPASLLRLTRALADESRLRILRHLSDERRSFTDLVRHTRLAKSTVHQHIVLLRAAGLVRTYEAPDGSRDYGLRASAADRLGEQLNAYFTGGRETRGQD